MAKRETNALNFQSGWVSVHHNCAGALQINDIRLDIYELCLKTLLLLVKAWFPAAVLSDYYQCYYSVCRQIASKGKAGNFAERCGWRTLDSSYWLLELHLPFLSYSGWFSARDQNADWRREAGCLYTSSFVYIENRWGQNSSLQFELLKHLCMHLALKRETWYF